eukprot:2832174-Ditylum_brightwellii.AAC.1
MSHNHMRGKYTTATNYLANAMFDKETKQDIEYRDLIKNPKYAKIWKRSAANEFGCLLVQGVRECIPTGTNTIYFIPNNKVLANKMPTYAHFDTNI